jgi:DNA modification methylase
MKGLFKHDYFETAIDRYGVWPTTVWDLDMGDRTVQKMKSLIGDLTDTRSQSGSLGYQTKQTRTAGGVWNKGARLFKKTTASIFNPLIPIYVLKMYGKNVKTIYDPFAGGGTRAIVCAKMGKKYKGCEIREDEVKAVNSRLATNDCHAEINHASATKPWMIPDKWADMVITCPPYYNMETYNGGENDLSMATTYSQFKTGIASVICECNRIMKPGAMAFWVVGLHRDKNMNLINIPSDIAEIHKSFGFAHKEEIILNVKKETTGALRRVGNFEKGNHILIRTHEYLEVFEKQTERKRRRT